MKPVETLPNIGRQLAKELHSIGIYYETELKELGNINTIIKLNEKFEYDSCINKLFAVEGAIQNIRWHNLDKKQKEILKNRYLSELTL